MCVYIYTHQCDVKEASSVVWPTAWKTNSCHIKGWADPASLIHDHRSAHKMGSGAGALAHDLQWGTPSPRPDAGAGRLHSNVLLQSSCSQSQHLIRKRRTDSSGKTAVKWDESTFTINAFSLCGVRTRCWVCKQNEAGAKNWVFNSVPPLEEYGRAHYAKKLILSWEQKQWEAGAASFPSSLPWWEPGPPGPENARLPHFYGFSFPMPLQTIKISSDWNFI